MEKRRKVKIWRSKRHFNNSGGHNHTFILYSNNMYTFPVYREQCKGFISEKLKTKITDTLDDQKQSI